jgi:hypothetical protein
MLLSFLRKHQNQPHARRNSSQLHHHLFVLLLFFLHEHQNQNIHYQQRHERGYQFCVRYLICFQHITYVSFTQHHHSLFFFFHEIFYIFYFFVHVKSAQFVLQFCVSGFGGEIVCLSVYRFRGRKTYYQKILAQL